MIELVTAIIKDDNGKILISKNGKEQNENSFWEFPTGKIEIGETDEEAITRGIKENLNIEVSVNNYITEKSFDYEEKIINLIAYDAQYEYGKIPENKEYKWVNKKELNNYNFKPLDKFIVKELNKNNEE